MTTPAEREARVLRYWHAAELLSPQRVPRLNPQNRREPVLRAGGATPLPWDTSGWFPPAEPGNAWRFTVYGGIFKLGRVRAFLERKFGRDRESFDRASDGESCLFAFQVSGDGRPLLDTFILASCPWALGRLQASAGGVDWTRGLEAAACEQKTRFIERFAVREGDELGRKLNCQPGVHVERPLQLADLHAEVDELARALGVAGLLQPADLRISSRQVDERYACLADSDDFLNSFFLRDLERVAAAAAESRNSAALSCFLQAEDALEESHRCDVRRSLETLWSITSPELVPQARWPTSDGESLYFSQQFAVNAVCRAWQGKAPMFGVNGPPGTGKTTLLRDIVAQVVMRRADLLATLAKPELAFTGSLAHWKTASSPARSISLWRDDLLGHEIVVASSNNRAVENVTLEIPSRGAVAEDYLAAIDYYSDFASRVLAEKQPRQSALQSDGAWGLIAARLGSKRNRRKFISRFWFADNDAPEPRSRARQGFQKYLQTVRPRVPWQTAVARFAAAREREAAIRRERITAWQQLERRRALAERITGYRDQLRWSEARAGEERKRLAAADETETVRRAALADSTEARRHHQQFKPGLVDAVFTFGADYHEWRNLDRERAAAIEMHREELRAAGTECENRRRELLKIDRETTSIREHLDEAEQERVQVDSLLETQRDRLGPALPRYEHWMSSLEERELSSPWADERWNRARAEVFVEALHLHRAFVECMAERIRKNLLAATDVLGGKVGPDPDPRALRSAWATLFFVVPVVSTTFASFDRLFAGCGRESLGYVLIDEAGQATPQSAAGALWRAEHALVVGDPRQLEPIVPLPFTAQQALRKQFAVEDTWLPSQSSVQSLADRVSRFGTWIDSHDGGQDKIWVGSPLRVHRRCERTMFDISNQIAYANQMVYDTPEKPMAFPPSCWFDISASESDGHWIPAEGVALAVLLDDLIRSGARPDSILLVSPFRVVARRIREIGARQGIRQAGTIHVSQGKEADIVILVLGGDPRRPGAKEWAAEKPNLLNVAVSRAKRRLYVIGNREEWRAYPHFSEAAAALGRMKQRATKSMSTSR